MLEQHASVEFAKIIRREQIRFRVASHSSPSYLHIFANLPDAPYLLGAFN